MIDTGQLLEFARRCAFEDERMFAAAIVRGEPWVRWPDGQVASPWQAWAELPFRLRAVESHVPGADGRCRWCPAAVWPCGRVACFGCCFGDGSPARGFARSGAGDPISTTGAEGELVAIHAHYRLDPEDRGQSVVDIRVSPEVLPTRAGGA